MIGALWRWPSAWLLASAAGRVRRTRADWAEAMMAEMDFCSSELDRLSWAWGCWVASLRTSFCLDGIVYCSALVTGLGLMTGYEWSADESRATVIILGVIALVLGALRPRQALLSGALVGLVVTGVIGFEALSGVRPAYEEGAQTLFDSLCWLILLVPALFSAAVGARIGRLLRSVWTLP